MAGLLQGRVEISKSHLISEQTRRVSMPALPATYPYMALLDAH